MMAWPTRKNNNSTIPESAFQWSDGESGHWKAKNLRQPETLFMSPSPDPSITTRTPIARPPSYNYQLQIPSAQLPSTPVALGAVLSPPHLSSYLHPSTIKHSINNHSPRSVLPQAINTALSPASLYDTRCPSPWDDLPVSTPIIKETLQPDETGKDGSQTKMPCRSRRPTATQKDSDTYGTFKCEWKDCQYDRLFSRKGVLMRHILTQHVNPRAFKCPLCDHASSRRENLKAHRQSIHKESL
ncbi:Zinc finger C2H2 [Penicillium expansum]|nr:Zinc finger C2H2 [Penicillium expansum]